MQSPELFRRAESIDPKIIESGVEKARDLVRTLRSRSLPDDSGQRAAFLESTQGRELLPYHNVAHTEDVITKFARITEFLRREGVDVGSERIVEIGKLGAAFHDSVQGSMFVELVEPDTVNGEPNPFVGHRKISRQRVEDTSEKPSAEAAIAYMRLVNEAKPNTFTSEDEQIVRGQIRMTVARFDMSLGTVVQPHLNENGMSSPVELALALADIGAAGMDAPEKFVAAGAALFREDNPDILDALYAKAAGKEIPSSDKEYYRARMISFSKTQPPFARGRMQALDGEIRYLPEAVREKLKRELFGHFETSIEAAEAAVARREGMNFEELAADMGYAG